ncbi:MAG: transcriptional regulator [Raineya sp.]|jgi:DNA-binding transcriptional regulator GbsR (MarR family)|nr:transcriptional regulator [Raineya sp.]
MDIIEAKEQFIQAWGTLGSSWGISRTMAQIHALLLVSSEPLSADDIMEKLQISRGNTNMTVRELIDWGLVYKEIIVGERREFFVAEKDMWQVSRCILRERKKRELDPLKRVFDSLAQVSNNSQTKDNQDFIKLIKDIQTLSEGADTILNKLIKVEKNWFLESFLKLFSKKKKISKDKA